MALISRDGVQLSFDAAGDGPPVLLLAGCGQPAGTWELFGAPALRDAGYRVVTMDNRGMAPSDAPPPPYSIADMAEDAAAVLEHLDARDAIVVGASMGAWIAVELAAHRPDLVRKAVMLVGLGRESVYSLTEMRAITELARAGVEWPESLSALDTVRTMLPPSAWQDDDQVGGIVAIAGAAFPPWANPGRLGQYEACLAWLESDHDDTLRSITRPCLVMAAEHDANATPTHLRAGASLIPDAQFSVIAGQNHIPIGAVDRVISEILSFIGNAESGG